MVKEATGCDGINVVQNNYPSSGQVVFHVHGKNRCYYCIRRLTVWLCVFQTVHVIPRTEGDELIKHPGALFVSRVEPQAELAYGPV